MIITLSGSNQFAIQEKLAEIKKEFVEKNGPEGVERYSGEQLSEEILTNITAGASLFATQRLIIIWHLSENKNLAERFLEFIDRVGDEITMVLVEDRLDKRTAFYKTLKKQSEFQELSELSEPELLNWIRARVTAAGGEIDALAARLLFEYIGSDQLRLDNEIAKLVAYQNKVDTDAIRALVEQNPRDTVFQLLEHVLKGERKAALGILDGLERAFEDPFQTANMLMWQAQVLAVVKSAGPRSDAEIAKDTKFNPYVIRKTKLLASRIDKLQLRKILSAVATLDTTLKTTSVEPWRAVEQTILSL